MCQVSTMTSYKKRVEYSLKNLNNRFESSIRTNSLIRIH